MIERRVVKSKILKRLLRMVGVLDITARDGPAIYSHGVSDAVLHADESFKSDVVAQLLTSLDALTPDWVTVTQGEGFRCKVRNAQTGLHIADVSTFSYNARTPLDVALTSDLLFLQQHLVDETGAP